MTPMLSSGTLTFITALVMLAFGLLAYRSIRKQLRRIDVPFDEEVESGLAKANRSSKQ